MTQSPEQVCREVYEETRSFYAAKEPELGDAALGFRVLYGPPVPNPPILFVGYQPGGDRTSISDDEHAGWPEGCEYAVASWKLAARLRSIWSKPVLERCTGLNAVFARSPSVGAWSRLPPKLRNEFEAFSMARAARITRALEPQRIVIIGLGTFDILTQGTVELRTERRVLVKRGKLWGAPAIGIVHLSGARVSRADLAQLSAYLAADSAE